MEILTFPLGQLQANCYFIIKDKECLIIDPADDASFILEEVQRRNLKVVGLLATHGHFDHVMAVGEIQMSLDLPLYINSADKFLIDRLGETAKHFLGYDPGVISPKKFSSFPSSNILHVSRFTLHVIPSPGHTPGSVCFYLPKEGILFTGDTLFKGSTGRYDFSYSSKVQLFESLKMLSELPDETIIYPGHGERSTIQAEPLFHF